LKSQPLCGSTSSTCRPFTEGARFQSWLDVEAALAELTIITAEMPDSSIHGMRIGYVFAARVSKVGADIVK
jgi:hypothetical protein